MVKQNQNTPVPKDFETFKQSLSDPIDYEKYTTRNSLNNFGSNNQIVLQSTLKRQQEEFQSFEYDTPNEAIFHRYADGTYQAKFKNYLGETGNEDRLGQLQSGWDQLGNGILKNARKMGNYVLDATVGTVAGVANMITTGSLSGWWNNDVSKTLDEWNQSLDYKLPNHYTNEQKSMGVLKSLGTMNFWANDVGGGLAFVGGALIPELALGLMTGGATLAGGLAKIGLKTSLKSAAKKGLKEGAEELFDPTNYINLTKSKLGYTKQSFSTEKLIQAAQKAKELDGGLDLMKASQNVKRYAAAGNVLDTGLFLTRTSGFEAGMEARHNFNESIDNYVSNFQTENGRTPTAEEIGNFTNDAVNVANGLFGANMAILSISNYAMFGRALGIKVPKVPVTQSVKNFFNSAIGLGVKESAEDVTKLALKGATRAQKLTGNAYKIFSKPLAEGVYEEGLQGVVGKTMQNYMEGKYSTDKDSTLDFTSSLYKSFGEQYGTKEGWKEMTVGMIIGFGGGVVTERSYKALPGIGNNSRKAAQEALGKDVDKVNTGVNMLRNMNRASSAANFRTEFENRASEGKRSTFEDSNINMAFIQSQESLKDLKTIKTDFNKTIDESDFSNLGFDKDSGEVSQYKEQLKQDFQNDITHYKNAKSLVANLDINNLPLGDKFEVKDYMTALFFNSGKSTERANSIGKQIDELTGENGSYNSLKVLSSLNQEQLDIYEKLDQNRQKTQELKDLAIKYSTDFSAQQTDKSRSEKYKEYAQKVAITQKRILELENESKSLTSSIGGLNNIQTDLDFGSTVSSTGAINTLAAVEQVSRLEEYVNQLNKTGRTSEAGRLETLLDDFKTNIGTSLQASIEASKIVAGSYNKTRKKGKKGVTQDIFQAILGPAYKLSEEVRQEFKQKEDILRRSFNSVFTSANFDLDEYLEGFENNPNLSAREKYKLENQKRILLSLGKLEELNKKAAQTLVEPGRERESVSIDKVTPNSTIFVKVTGSDTFQTGTVTANNTVQLSDDSEVPFEQIEEAEAYAKAEPTNQKLKVEEIEQKRFWPLFYTKSKSKINKINSEFDKRYLELISKGEITPKVALESLYLNNRQAGRVFKKIQKDSNIVFNNKFIDVIDGISLSENLGITNSDTIGKVINDTLKEIEKIRKGDQAKVFPEKPTPTPTPTAQAQTDPTTQQQTTTRTEEKSTEQEVIPEEDMASPVTIVDTEGFKRFSELSSNEERTPEEEAEYNQLKAEIDDWTIISGITISGVNLSDLIEQKSFLDSVKTEVVPIIEQKQELGDMDKKEKFQNTNYTFSLNYFSVHSTKNPDNSYTISYISPEAFLESIGVDIFTKDGSSFIFELQGEMHSITQDYLGNLVIQEELVSEINNSTNLRILSTTDGDYSVVYKFNSENVASPLKSNFNSEYNKKNQPVEESVIYQTKGGENISFQIDPLDDYNVPLLKAYSNAVKSGKEENIQRAKLNIQNKAVIRAVNSKGQTLGFLKGNRTQKDNKITKEDLQFLAMRMESLDSEELLSKAANTKTIQKLPIKGAVVSKVLIGRPNINVEKGQDNLSTVTNHRPIRSEDTTKVLDIGYIEEGAIFLRNQVKASTQLVTKIQEKSTYMKGKTPVVVLSKAGKNFIFPVRTTSIEPVMTEEFIDIFSSKSITNTEKAIKLNNILAENKIDVNVKGNAFIDVGANNLTQEFFDEKLNQILNSERHNDISNWTDKKSNMESIITQEILLNLNVNDPIHSPKIDFDFSGVVLKDSATATVAKAIKTKDTEAQNNKTVGNVSRLKNLVDDINKKAADKLDENC